MKSRSFLLFIVVFALTLLGPVEAFAQGSAPSDDDVNRIAKELYCPVCENTPLDVCPTQACAEWREQIRLMLAEGKTDAEIKQYFVDYYGARVLAEPPRQGFNWLAYLVPPVLIAFGIFVLARTLKGWAKHDITESHGGESEPQAEVDEYVRRLEEELHKRQ